MRTKGAIIEEIRTDYSHRISYTTTGVIMPSSSGYQFYFRTANYTQVVISLFIYIQVVFTSFAPNSFTL